MMGARNDHCCLCGEPRRPTQAPLESFGNDCEIVAIEGNRPLQPGRWEASPQMLVNVSMWRNGGTAPGQTHICDGCVVLGLKYAKAFVDDALSRLSASSSAVGEAPSAQGRSAGATQANQSPSKETNT